MTDLQGETMPARKPSLKCRLAMIFITAVTVAFLAGYAVGNRRSDQRCQEAGRQKMLEFLTVAADLDLINMQRLREVVCTASEAGGEDDGVSTNEAIISTNETAGGDHLKENE